MLRDIVGKRVLLLQGPNGPFFRRFASELSARGCRVTKVNFNSGDDLFYRGGDLVRFREPMAAWPAFCRELMAARSVEVVVVYGDQRPIHRVAIAAAHERGAHVVVLEEGYLRPDFVTVEHDGANANSPLPRDPSFFRAAAADLPELPPAVPLGNTFRAHAWLTALHATAFTWFAFRYPHYEHHRDINAYKQAFYWTRAGVRKLVYERRERGALERIVHEGAPPFFLLPLQVHCDAQFSHSRFESMEDVIAEVMEAFAEHAPAGTRLVIKHHPHDRGYTDYAPLVQRLAARSGMGDRVLYVHDLHLPTLLKHARGVITMNSTVGISALFHGAPVKVLGAAMYDVPGLTSQAELAEFLVAPGEVDPELVRCFIRVLRAENQANGSFYTRAPGLLRCGLEPAVFEGPGGERPPTPSHEHGNGNESESGVPWSGMRGAGG